LKYSPYSVLSYLSLVVLYYMEFPVVTGQNNNQTFSSLTGTLTLLQGKSMWTWLKVSRKVIAQCTYFPQCMSLANVSTSHLSYDLSMIIHLVSFHWSMKMYTLSSYSVRPLINDVSSENLKGKEQVILHVRNVIN
jgi:hypothetical protein